MKRAMLFHLMVVSALCVCSLTAFAQDGQRKMINGGILNGKAVSLPRPEYPAGAKAAGLEGTVFVDVIVDDTGSVVSAVAVTEPRKIRRPGHEDESEVPVADILLRDSAERAALKAKFSPTLINTYPAPGVTGTIVYHFVAANSPSVINGGIVNGKATNLPKPEYPAAALAVRAQGTVSVQITIDENGQVIAATAVSGHPLLRAAAVEAAKGASFSPTFLSGQPVKVAGVVTYNFVAPTDGTN